MDNFINGFNKIIPFQTAILIITLLLAFAFVWAARSLINQKSDEQD